MRSRGMSITEWLLVILILGILVVMLILPMLRPGKSAKIAATRAFLKSIDIACQNYEFDCGAYPPDKSIVDGKTLKSSEALYYYLTTAFRKDPKAGERKAAADVGPYLIVPAKHLADADGNGFPEILDYWGRPLQYDNIRDDPARFDFYGVDDVRIDMRARNEKGFDLFTQPTPSDDKPITNWDGK
jgi:type II secretory pathway pseudopilin PulG